MGLLWRKKRKEIKTPSPEEKEPKSMEALIKEYRLEKFVLSYTAQKYHGNIPEHELTSLRKIEEQIINLLPDDFQRSVFRILARHKFDIVDFLKKEDWREDLRTTCRDICHFLYYGVPYPKEPEWEPLPFPGNEFFFWLLKQAKKHKESDDDIANILNAFTHTQEILGCRFSKEERCRIANPLLTVFIGEWRKQTLILIDILYEVEGGESFIRELLGLKK
ncbi:hypothetical protein MYX07_03160 [Patescibacteria group bacterium AH-259-L07]|nr:hypothetical protein [Patescibacteria group bacterium AH-259-L07]